MHRRRGITRRHAGTLALHARSRQCFLLVFEHFLALNLENLRTAGSVELESQFILKICGHNRFIPFVPKQILQLSR